MRVLKWVAGVKALRLGTRKRKIRGPGVRRECACPPRNRRLSNQQRGVEKRYSKKKRRLQLKEQPRGTKRGHRLATGIPAALRQRKRKKHTKVVQYTKKMGGAKPVGLGKGNKERNQRKKPRTEQPRNNSGKAPPLLLLQSTALQNRKKRTPDERDDHLNRRQEDKKINRRFRGRGKRTKKEVEGCVDVGTRNKGAQRVEHPCPRQEGKDGIISIENQGRAKKSSAHGASKEQKHKDSLGSFSAARGGMLPPRTT